MSIYKTNVSKEDFKRAYTTCAKEAWIMHSKENFEKAYQLLQDKKFQFNVDVDVEDEDALSSDASAINVLEAFQEALKDDPEQLKKWNEAWEDPEGFEVENYAGDSIEDGNAVGAAARELFNKKLALTNNDDLIAADFSSYISFKEAVKKTRKLLDDNKGTGKLKYLYEPAFGWDDNNLKVRCDILEMLNDTDVIIYEVKATSKVKKEHFFDLAYQRFVLEQNGFNVKNMFIVHMAPDYIYGINHPMDLKETANSLEESFQEMSYEEVTQYVKDNDLLKPFTNPNKEDINLDKMFDIDPLTFGDAKDRLTLMEVYDGLAKSHDINLLITNLAKQLAIGSDDDKGIANLFNQELCPDFMEYKKKSNSWEYKDKYCYHVLPYYDKNIENIFNFTGNTLHNDVKAELFRKTGKMYLKDISSLSKDFPLKQTKKESKSYFSHEHERHFEVYKEFLKQGKVTSDMIIDINNLEEIRKILKEYHDAKHVYMFDFETVKFAIPRFYYSKSYQQIPFQYSIDVISDENYDYNKPETMDHHDFIGNERIDPRPEFIIHFIKDILMSHGEGVYVAYNKSFERTVLKYLAAEFPKYKVPLLYVATHTIDLMDFFKGNKKQDRENFLIYHPDFHGSYSIKKTQPALDPKFNYHDLTINKGDKAAQVWRMYCEGQLDDEKWKTVKPNMIKYCNRDTLAMVVILQQVEKHLKEVDKQIEERKGEIHE